MKNYVVLYTQCIFTAPGFWILEYQLVLLAFADAHEG